MRLKKMYRAHVHGGLDSLQSTCAENLETWLGDPSAWLRALELVKSLRRVPAPTADA